MWGKVTQKCTKCNVEKPVEEFSKQRGCKGGRRPSCKACVAAQMRERNRLGRQFLQEYKVKLGCADCGYNEHHAGLEFDHVDGDKKYNVSELTTSPNKLEQELAKCEVVCGTCHNIRTWERRNENVH